MIAAETFDAILSDIADGSSMRAACAKHEVTRQSFLRYVDQDKARADQYARAMTAGCEALADDILGISDDSSRDVVQTDDGPVVNHDVIQRSRLRVDSRKWLLSKRLPKKYGDKLMQEHSGPDGGPMEVRVSFVSANAGGVPVPVVGQS